MDIHLLYSNNDTPPISTDDEYLIIEDCMSDDDDQGMELIGEDIELLDKSIYPERYGHYKTLQIYLNPDQVETNAAFLKSFLNAPYVWVLADGGNYAGGSNVPLLSTFDYGTRKISFLDMFENPLGVKSCEVFGG